VIAPVVNNFVLFSLTGVASATGTFYQTGSDYQPLFFKPRNSFIASATKLAKNV
jgi:hypothetical protein